MVSGTRSVSTLTPSQLARKRANDREAQRAIRARTKEHIESLERQVEELRSQQGHDRFVQDLLRRNKSLEDELRRLRESLGLPANGGSAGSIYTSSSSGYSGASLRTPPFCPAMPEYQVVQDGHGQYSHMPESGENWPQTSMPGSVSTVSSPSSRNEEYGTNNYLSNGMQSGVLERVSSMTPGVNSAMSSPGMGIKGGFEDIKSGTSIPPLSTCQYIASQLILILY